MSTRFERNLYFAVMGEAPPRSARRAARRGPPRDERYLDWIRTLPCEACGRAPRSEAAHTGSDGGTGIKASDYSAVPLCPHCHKVGPDSYHMAGRRAFAAMWCIDYNGIVARLNSVWEQLQKVKIFRRA
jgi:hypothetical protein